jgi:hypothetical protein
VCSVHTTQAKNRVRFEAINEHWPEGKLSYATTIEKGREGAFEVSHSHSLLFDLSRDKTYPEYPFMFERYDVFYALCFKPAQILPEEVLEFLRKYSTQTYKDSQEKSEDENITARNYARRFYYYKI